MPQFVDKLAGEVWRFEALREPRVGCIHKKRNLELPTAIVRIRVASFRHTFTSNQKKDRESQRGEEKPRWFTAGQYSTFCRKTVIGWSASHHRTYSRQTPFLPSITVMDVKKVTICRHFQTLVLYCFQAAGVEPA